MKGKTRNVCGPIVLIGGALWTVLFGLLFYWNIRSEYDHTLEVARYQTDAFYKKIIATRIWNALNGGVYVPVSESSRPDPYVDIHDRDVKTVDGRDLTLVTPAFMTQQIADVSARENGVRFHLVSMAPVNDKNFPDTWEETGLEAFERGSSHQYGFYHDEKGHDVFRYIAPVYLEESCMKCHSKFGDTEGQMGGGISVTLDAEPLLRSRDNTIKYSGLTLALLWVMGLTGGGSALVYLSRKEREKDQLIDQLGNALHEVERLNGLMPICCSCKKIRDDKGYWQQIEQYFSDRSNLRFSHGLCPECANKMYPDLMAKIQEKKNRGVTS